MFDDLLADDETIEHAQTFLEKHPVMPSLSIPGKLLRLGWN